MLVRTTNGQDMCDMTAVRDELDRIAQAAPHVPRRVMRCPPRVSSSTGPIHSPRHRDASETRQPRA
jgi:hypothetical protein